MNLQDSITYIFIGISIIGVAYFSWASRKGQGSSEEPEEPKDK